MSRRLALGAAGTLALCAGVFGFVAWVTREVPSRAGPAPGAVASAAAPPSEALAPLPSELVARELALEANEAAAVFEALRSAFEAAPQRTPPSEGRLLRALDDAFPGRTPRFRVECRRLLCRLEVDAPAAEWRTRLERHAEVRRQAERIGYHPGGEPVAFVELVELRVADGPRPEGERILAELERALLASEAARRCVTDGPVPRAAGIRLMIDPTGVTFRFDAGVDSKVAYCLMTEAMPDLLATVSAPPGVKRAERKLRVGAP